MSRSHETCVVYRDEIELPPSSLVKLAELERWMTSQMELLERRWGSISIDRSQASGTPPASSR